MLHTLSMFSLVLYTVLMLILLHCVMHICPHMRSMTETVIVADDDLHSAVHWPAYKDANENPDALRSILELQHGRDPNFDLELKTGTGTQSLYTFSVLYERCHTMRQI